MEGSVDLVTVAQALHWLDLGRFYGEVRRVLKPGGAIAVWCYGHVQIDAEVDEVIRWFLEERIRRFSAPELDHVHTLYRDIDFPFDEIEGKSWALETSVTLADFLGFVGSWSAVAAARRETGADPVKDLRGRLSSRWRRGDPARVVRFPIGLRVGVVT